LEELRAFLTSVLVAPTQSPSGLRWVRRWLAERPLLGPTVVTRSHPAAARTLEPGSAQPTELAK
jgi:hypothetical protein